MRWRRGRKKRVGPEESILLRAVALVAVMIAVIALVAQGAVDTSTEVGALLLIPVGFAFSHLRRTKRNTILKLGLAAAMFAALWAFIQAVRTAPSVDDARVALASMFVWTQVLHSFDLPRRRDLSFSIVASMIVMAEAGSLSLGSGFVIFVVPYAAASGAWLYLSHRADEEEGSDLVIVAGAAGRTIRSRERRSLELARSLAAAAVVVVLIAGLVFMAAPRVRGIRIVAPPFSITRKVAVPGFVGGVVNPGLPSQAGTASTSLNGAYPGFGDSVDLGVRFQLSDRVVMKVRAQNPAFWRAQAYDAFDGKRWTATDQTVQAQNAVFEPPITLARPGGAAEAILTGAAHTTELIQTYYILERQPNVVFAAYQPRDLYFPVNEVLVDSYGSIRTPLFLEADTIYSVISAVPAPSVADLRGTSLSPPDLSPEVKQRYQQLLSQYTQLPPDLSPRVVHLAHLITDAAPTPYDKVIAVQDWLKANMRYNLAIPPDPPGVGALEEFLFNRRQGYCEHFSTAMAVLLRSVGIPARFAVGFGSGERNAFTGYFEVRESDAHSWVEVFYPGSGWIEYDPTHDVPQADPGLADRFIAPQVLRAVGRFLARVVPDPVKAAVLALVSGAAALWRRAWNGWSLVVFPFLSLFVAWVIPSRRGRGRLRAPSRSPPTEAFGSMCRTFEARGHPRLPHRTPDEHLLALVVEDRLAAEAREDLELIVRTFEREAFSGRPADPDQGRRAHSAAERVRDLAGSRPR
jgi:transglutaminase-like putative cysteine protease